MTSENVAERFGVSRQRQDEFAVNSHAKCVLCMSLCCTKQYNHSHHCHHWSQAVLLHCCKARAKISGKMGNSTPCKIVTPKNFILKLCTHDYVCEVTRHANFRFNRYSGDFSPNRRNITTLWLFWLSCPVLTFFSRSYAQVEPLDWFSRFMAQTTCFRARMVLWGLERWVTLFGGNMPQNPPKWAWIVNFQSKRKI